MVSGNINLTGFSVVEDATPVDPSDTSGGVGQITLTASEYEGARKLLNEIIDLRIATQGITRGIIKNLSGSDGDLNITANSTLDLLLSERTLLPFVGSFGDAIRYYLGVVGITTNILIDSSLDANPVVYPGLSGTIWDWLRKILYSQKAEIALVSNNIVVRPVRLRVAENYRDSSRTWSLDTSDLAQSVQVHYYQNVNLINQMFYPYGGWTEDVPIYTVESGETVVVEIPIDGSLTSISQPVPLDYVSKDFDTAGFGSSVYSVSGNDGLPYLAAQWTALGGNISVAIGEDTRSIKLTIVGPADPAYSPYSISASAGTSSRYSSLRILGSGVAMNLDKFVTVGTGVGADLTSTEVGVVVENEAIVTEAQAIEAAMWAIKKFGGVRRTLSVTTSGINRLGDSGAYYYATIDEFNTWAAAQGLVTINDFNTFYSGKDMDFFNNFWLTQNSDDFENQAFGNVSGARVYDAYTWYRIRSATISQDAVSYSAEEDTIIQDFNDLWAGKTINDFNNVWLGKTMDDFNDEPMRMEF